MRTNVIANADVGRGAGQQGATYTKYIDLLFVIDCASGAKGWGLRFPRNFLPKKLNKYLSDT